MENKINKPNLKEIEEFFKEGEEIRLPSVVSSINIEGNLSLDEKIIRFKMQEGWNIHIECKAKGREYEMSYEATAQNINDDFRTQIMNNKHGVGDTLSELIVNLFGIEEYRKLTNMLK